MSILCVVRSINVFENKTSVNSLPPSTVTIKALSAAKFSEREVLFELTWIQYDLDMHVDLDKI